MSVLDPIALTDSILLSSNVAEDDYPVYDPTAVYATADRVIVTTGGTHAIYEQEAGVSHAVTLTIATPCVVSWVGHGQAADQPVKLTTTGALPTGLVAGTTYYVKSPATDSFQLSATPGGAAIATTGTQSGTHTVVANAIGLDPVTNPTAWTKVSATNRWAMFDDRNDTQTANSDSIAVTMLTSSLAGGVYLGNLDATEVTITLTDAVEGVVYSKTTSLIQSNSGSSFYNWFFKRIIRKTWFLALDLPMYLNATLAITISNPGGTARCGVCYFGPVVDIGGTEWGVSGGIKDYSVTTFSADGVSTTEEHPYAKEMSMSVLVDNDLIDSMFDQMVRYRGRRVVWIGISTKGWTVLVGRFTDFKCVIPNLAFSRMAIEIEGSV